jgi:amino acid adenylation domain-containing protein
MGPAPAHAGPSNGSGLLQLVLDFTEAMVPALFFSCLQGVLDRHHEMCRTFGSNRPNAADDNVSSALVPTAVRDWQQLDPDDAERQFDTLLSKDRALGFDPTIAPLLRAVCMMLPEGRTRILITYDRLILDGIARNAMLRELISSYDTTRTGRPYTPPTRHALVDAVLPDTDARLYWQGALAGLNNGNVLPDMQMAPGTAWAKQGTLHRELSSETLAGLRDTAAVLKSSLAMVVYAAWALCLHRLLHDDDIAFLTIRNLRTGTRLPRGPHLQSLVNAVPLRVQVARGQTVAELVAAVSAFWNASRPHMGAGLAHIFAWCGLGGRIWDNNILFQRDRITGWFANTAQAGTQRRMRVLQYSDTPLTVAVMQGATLDIHFQYWIGAHRPGVLAALADTFATVLAGFAGDPNRRVGDLPYLSASQREWIERSSRGPVQPDAMGLLLHADFVAQAARQPAHVALISGDGSLTYGDLAGAANALAHVLVEAGVAREEPVAILAERNGGCLVAVFAVLQAGAALLPLATSYPDPELRRTLQAAGVKRCLAAPDLAARAAGLGCTVLPLEPGMLARRADAPPAMTISPDQLAYLIATSGTTGLPKIVEVPHCAAANTLRHSLATLYAEGDLELVPWTDSLAADASIHQIFAPLARGGALVQIGNLAKLKTSRQFRSFTTFGATPSMLANLLAADALPPSLRAVMFGGENCPANLPPRLKATTTIRRAINVYGPTEAAIYCTADDVMAPANGISRSIGRPITNMRVVLLDEQQQPVVPGTIGEICISGIGLARGYRGRPDLTDAAFPVVSVPTGIWRRVYRSGDLAALLPDGRLEFHGRCDRQVKIRGLRVELDAIEHALGGLEGVCRAVVAVRQIGSNDQRLVGWIMAAEGFTVVEAELRAQLRTLLPGQMVPDTIILVGEIALTQAGKPDMAALPDWLPDPAPSRANAKAPSGLLTLIATTLKLPVEAIGDSSSIHNTAEWDSIRHIMIMMCIEETYGIVLSDAEIASATTITRMREILRSRSIRDQEGSDL